MILYLNLLDLPRIEQESAKAYEEMRKEESLKKRNQNFIHQLYCQINNSKNCCSASLSRVKEALYVARHASPYTSGLALLAF